VPDSVTAEAELLAQVLGSRYTVEREFAQGGMATVYLAQDTQQDRQVAVKVMHSKVADALGAERFLREIEIARSMAHPLIVPLTDSGNAGGLLYYIMPYVEGESLFHRMEREKRLPWEDAVRITRDVAEALGYAHARGVLHRDVKPENILLGGGRALVADFGLARAIGAADYEKLTKTGMIVGTVFYMSPEQLREDKDLDQRADIYSLGCILFEMLTGTPPYTGSSIKEVVMKILRSPIPSAREQVPGIPEAVDRAIARTLAKGVSERFASMEEFAAALPK
jgi:serine/threonine protein kinase